MKTVTAAIIEKDGMVLIAQRAVDDKLALKWEFPGGKVEPGESPEQCLVREIKEELNLDITINEYFATSEYHYDHGSIALMAFWCRLEGGDTMLRVHNAVNWVEIQELQQYDFCPADIPLVEGIIHAMKESHLSGCKYKVKP